MRHRPRPLLGLLALLPSLAGAAAPVVESTVLVSGATDLLLPEAQIANLDAGNLVAGSTRWDSDGDGTANCNDGCPNDANKTAPGTCGCGVADTDTDADGTPNCNDGCPNDANKISPGTCGCGVADTDTDGDGTANCHDGCPNDPNKIAPGACGCGNPDTDCAMEIYGLQHNGGGSPRAMLTSIAVDGEVGDADGVANGVCSFPIGVRAPATDGADADGGHRLGHRAGRGLPRERRGALGHRHPIADRRRPDQHPAAAALSRPLPASLPKPGRRGRLFQPATRSASATPSCSAALPPIILAISSSGTPPPRSVAIASHALVVS